MFYKKEKFKKRVYEFVDSNEKFEKKMKLLPVDFSKPWWQIIWSQKGFAAFIIFVQVSWSVSDALFPIMLAYAVNQQSIAIFLAVVGLRLFLTWLYNIMFHYNAIFQIQTMSSVEYEANKYFLTVDPVYHSTKSSGQIISKVNRGSAAYEDILDVMTFDLLSIIINLVTVTAAMFVFGWQLGLIAGGFIVGIVSFNIICDIIRISIFEPIKIESEDKSKAINLETLQQAPFIRTIFATTEQMIKSKKALLDQMVKEANNWQSGTYVNVVSRTAYISSFMILGLNVFWQLQAGNINTTIAIGILLTYANGTQPILYIGYQMKKLNRSIAAITDLFTFIRGFGKQTYPVLESDNDKNLVVKLIT